MKKLKFFALILVCILSAFNFASCKTGRNNDEYVHEKFYGVVRHLEEFNQLVIYIPDIGDVAIPESESTLAVFDGCSASENQSYKLKEGDLVAVNFKYEKSWDEGGVPIMESYPARFGRNASVIEALAENITFEKTDKGYIFSFPQSYKTESFTVGEEIYFFFHGGKNGAAYKEFIAEGIVTNVSSERISVKLTAIDSEKDFLEKYLSSSIEKSPGE